MNWKEIEGKKVYVRLLNGRIYSGTVKEFSFVGYDADDVALYMISIIDKFDKFVSFSSQELAEIREE